MRPHAFLLVVSIGLILTQGVATAQAQQYAALWEEATDPNYLWVGVSWDNFKEKWSENNENNLRLVDFETYLKGDERKYAGVWREGNDAHYLWVGKSWDDFEEKWKELSEKKLRLVDIEVYTVDYELRYAGVWREGSDAHYLWVGKDWKSFLNKWKELNKKKLRLIDIETYTVEGERRYTGVWRGGDEAHYLWVGKSWDEFIAKRKELSKKKLQLIDIETYESDGERKYAGIWQATGKGQYLWAGVDFENLRAKRYELRSSHRLIDLEAYPGCDAACTGQVSGGRSYNRKIETTKAHCEIKHTKCPKPTPGDVVGYHRPVIVDGDQEYPRLSAMYFNSEPFTLPFDDKGVERRGIWIYGSGTHHYAADYSKDDNGTFRVRAAAGGRVIYNGWHWNSGNTIIVSHDEGTKKDGWRTIYMHLRNGARNDCELAWTKSVPALSGDRLEDYKKHLVATGCEDASSTDLDEDNWGTQEHKFNKKAGKDIFAGEFLGWAGNTGPGGKGKRDDDDSNTHLHIKFALKDKTDGKWYLLDPYGIYGAPECYPEGIIDDLDDSCVRYPVAWKGGKPNYP